MAKNKVFMDARNVIRVLGETAEQQLSVETLIEVLNKSETDSVWDTDRLKSVLDYSIDRGGDYAGLATTQGGNAIRLSSNERVGLNTGAYKDIVEAIGGGASNLPRIFSARNPVPHDVHIIGRRAGHWSRPDLLVEFRSRRSAPDPSEIHSIEFELPGHAWPENVAQAYVSGRGATKSWLLFSLDDFPETDAELEENFEWRATEALARDLGVGLIGYEEISAASSWRRVLKARKRSTDRIAGANLRDLLSKVKLGKDL